MRGKLLCSEMLGATELFIDRAKPSNKERPALPVPSIKQQPVLAVSVRRNHSDTASTSRSLMDGTAVDHDAGLPPMQLSPPGPLNPCSVPSPLRPLLRTVSSPVQDKSLARCTARCTVRLSLCAARCTVRLSLCAARCTVRLCRYDGEAL